MMQDFFKKEEAVLVQGEGCWIEIRMETSGEKQNLSFPLLKNKKINLFLTTIKSSVFLNHIFTVSQNCDRYKDAEYLQ